MSTLSDESLLAGFASRDPEVTAAFVRRFQGRVFGLATTILKDTALAEEVAQETFVRVAALAGAYDARNGPVDTWLLTITRNLALDVRRARSREIDDLDETSVLGLESTELESPGRGLPREDPRALRQAILELSEEQRRVLFLAAFQGRSGKEISVSEGIPLGTVQTRLRASMLHLRTALEVRHDQ